MLSVTLQCYKIVFSFWRGSYSWSSHRLERRIAVEQLERREAAMLQLVPPMVRRLQRQWERATIALVVTVVSGDPDQGHHRGCEPHRGLITDRSQHVLLTPPLAHRRQQTGPASTSPHHFELSAADGTTFA